MVLTAATPRYERLGVLQNQSGARALAMVHSRIFDVVVRKLLLVVLGLICALALLVLFRSDRLPIKSHASKPASKTEEPSQRNLVLPSPNESEVSVDDDTVPGTSF